MAREWKSFENQEKSVSVMIIANFTGFRCSEIKRIDVDEHINYNAKRIWLGETKNGDKLWHPLNDTALYEFKKYRGQGKCFDYYFEGFLYDVIEKSGLNKNTEEPWQRVCVHTFRHTYGTWLHEFGDKGIYAIMHLMRLKSIDVAKRYVKVSDKKMSADNCVMDTIICKSLQEQESSVVTEPTPAQ